MKKEFSSGLENFRLFYFLFFRSGYGSAAVSTSNLLSEDSLSIRSISVDDSPEDGKSYLVDETTTSSSLLSSSSSSSGMKIKTDNTPNNHNNNQQSSGNRLPEGNGKVSSHGMEESRKYLSVNDKGGGGGGDGSSSKSVSGDESANEGISIVSTKLPPGKVCFIIFSLSSWYVCVTNKSKKNFPLSFRL